MFNKTGLTLFIILSLAACEKDEYFQKSVAIQNADDGGESVVIMEPPVSSPEDIAEVPEVPTEEVPVATPPTPVQVELECAKALADGVIKEKVYRLNFEPVQDCPWGQDGNVKLSEGKNCVFGARSEIEKKILLPDDASRFCDLNFKFNNKKQRFDDEVLVTLQDYVLISSQDYSSDKIEAAGKRFQRDKDGMMKYDWAVLANSPYYKNVNGCPMSKKKLDHYCLGYQAGSEDFKKFCKLPPTEKEGEMSIDLPKSSIFKLSAKIGVELDKKMAEGEDKELSLKIITLGDDNKYDCGHRGADIEVRVMYISR